MARSVFYSQIALRIGLAIVFLWFGIDKFIHPVLGQVGYLMGVFGILAALSFITSVFMRIFALLAVVLVIFTALKDGISTETIGDFGMIGGLIALTIWPERT